MARAPRTFARRVHLTMTPEMFADLELMSAKTGHSVNELIRQAIRNTLDGTDLTWGTRRTFDRRFQRRMDELEEWLILLLVVMSKHFARDYGSGKTGGHLVKEVLEGDFQQMVKAAQEMFQRAGKKT